MEHVFPKGAHHMHGAQWKGTFLVWKPGFLPFTQIPFPQATLFCMAWWGESIPRFRVENQTHPPKTNHQKRENAFTLQIQRPLLSLSLSLSSPAPHPPSARVWPSVRLAALEARELREAPHLGAAEASVAVAVQGGEDRGLQVVAAPEVRANRPAAPVRWCVRW